LRGRLSAAIVNPSAFTGYQLPVSAAALFRASFLCGESFQLPVFDAFLFSSWVGFCAPQPLFF
jgi:hypothetical protein